MRLMERIVWGAGFVVVGLAAPFVVRHVRGTGVRMNVVNRSKAPAVEELTVTSGQRPLLVGHLAGGDSRPIELDNAAEPVRVHYVVNGRVHDDSPVLPTGACCGDRLVLDVGGDTAEVHADEQL